MASLELDGELSELEQATLTRHLFSCADCRALGVEFAALTRLLREAPLVEPATRLYAPPRRARTRTARRAAISLAFAGLVAAASLGGFALRGPGGSASSALSFRDAKAQRLYARIEARRIEPAAFIVAVPRVQSFASRALV